MTDYFAYQDREADELRRERAAEERARFEPLPVDEPGVTVTKPRPQEDESL